MVEATIMRSPKGFTISGDRDDLASTYLSVLHAFKTTHSADKGIYFHGTISDGGEIIGVDGSDAEHCLASFNPDPTTGNRYTHEFEITHKYMLDDVKTSMLKALKDRDVKTRLCWY